MTAGLVDWTGLDSGGGMESTPRGSHTKSDISCVGLLHVSVHYRGRFLLLSHRFVSHLFGNSLVFLSLTARL